MRLLVTDAAAQPPRQATAWLIMTFGEKIMKLAQCIIAFERAIMISHRPEDRLLGSNYLAALASLLAHVIEKEEIQSRIKDIDRLFSQTWIIDAEPFKEGFDLWKSAKEELQK